MVALDSADVWARQPEFRLDLSLGVPPDAFSETGQDWNLPVYRWDVMERGGFEWLTSRARRYADLFDGYRVDHLVGFFRTFFREPGGASGFTPADEPEQVALGEHILRVFLASGATIVAEDLGVVPDFVREAMARLGVPGCKVLRWERHWQTPGHPFVDPAEYPVRSMATTGTHDTEPLVTWWRDAPAEDRAAALELPLVKESLGDASADSGELTARLAGGVARGGVRVPVRAGDHPRTRRLRLVRPDQHAGGRGRRELDVATALGCGFNGRSTVRCRGVEAAQPPGRSSRTLVHSSGLGQFLRGRTQRASRSTRRDLCPGVLERNRPVEHRRPGRVSGSAQK